MLDLDARGPFRNEPFTDFSQPVHRAAFAEALDRVRSQLGATYPLLIDGKQISTPLNRPSVNPSKPSEIIGRFASADLSHVDAALEAASAAFDSWKRTSAGERAAILFRAADLMRARRHDFSAWMVFEVGKSWAEADGDTAEAIDFLDYYAREMLRLDRGASLTPVAGERNEMVYIPLGVGAVIPPWNFPNAILTGMTSAALVAGNTVLLKPAHTSMAIGWQVASLLIEAGIPDGVLNFLTGSGALIGEAMIDDPRTRFIAFTGSKEVGLRINERAARPQPGQRWIKRVILEMGGKDAIVVDETADLDAAAISIVTSAFGYSGQKCSAGSRAIVVADVYDEVLAKVLARTQEIVNVGDPVDPDVFMGPVIDDSAFDKILDYIAVGGKEGRIAFGGGRIEDTDGYFLEPTVIADVSRDDTVAQEEIFGPVLSFMKARDFDDAMDIANSTPFGLTGSLYSTDRARIERAKDEFFVGNLYFNRKCTGAMVGGHPFGGFNLSGTDSKAGGPDYLLLFTQPKALSEKL